MFEIPNFTLKLTENFDFCFLFTTKFNIFTITLLRPSLYYTIIDYLCLNIVLFIYHLI